MKPPSGNCVSCGAPTSLRCSRCVDGLDKDGRPLMTYFCGKECQKSGFQEHKIKCQLANARKQVYRGAEVIQDVYYALREAAFDIDPTELKVVDGKIHFSLVMFTDKHEPGQWPFYPFPKAALPNTEDQKALLVWNSCEDAIAYTHGLAEKVFKGAVNLTAERSPDEVSFVMKKEHTTIVRTREDGIVEDTRFGHQVLLVSLENNERYIIDPAGAQYRQYRAAMHMDDYVKQYAAGFVGAERFGYWDLRWKNAVKYQNDPALIETNFDRMYVFDRIVWGLNQTIGYWERRNGKTMAQMLNQRLAAYETDKTSLLEELKDDFEKDLQFFKSSGKLSEAIPVSKEDLPEFKDEKNPKGIPGYSFGIAQDVKDRLDSLAGQGMLGVDMSALRL